MASPKSVFMSRLFWSGWLVGGFAKRAGLGEFAAGLRHIGAFALEIFVDRAAKPGVGNVMRRKSGLGKIAARDLVLALRPGLDGFQAARNRKIDRLIIADLEMQERMMLDRTPVAAEQRVAADEIDGARDVAASALRHHEQDAFGHRLADEGEELARQVRPSPFARARLHVE